MGARHLDGAAGLGEVKPAFVATSQVEARRGLRQFSLFFFAVIINHRCLFLAEVQDGAARRMRRQPDARRSLAGLALGSR